MTRFTTLAVVACLFSAPVSAEEARIVLWNAEELFTVAICLTHLKSSHSGDELENAMKREYVAASMVLSVLDDKQRFPDYTYIVAGDLNVGATDTAKNGKDLDVDATSGSQDRYDNTHAILRDGIIQGLKMMNLCLNVGETYDDPQFAGSGPIDCIYVDGTQAVNLTEATKTAKTYGPDHFGVLLITLSHFGHLNRTIRQPRASLRSNVFQRGLDAA